MRTVPAEYTDVYLAGELGKKFGRKWRLVCRTPKQALRLIGLARPDFKAYMMESARDGVNFHVICDRRSRSEEQLGLPAGERLIISHAVDGAKGVFGSVLEIVAGAALVALAIWNPVGWVGAGALMSSGTAAAVGSIGMSLVLAGITQLLSPQQPGSAASYYFNGGSTTNTITQGQPVPVVYGQMLVGGLPVSSSLQAVDLSAAPTETGLILD
jgi:predicted phage tail protein